MILYVSIKIEVSFGALEKNASFWELVIHENAMIGTKSINKRSFVLYTWPNYFCVELCQDVDLFMDYDIKKIPTIEFLVLLREFSKKYIDNLYLSLYSYLGSGPLSIYEASGFDAGFACRFFGKEVAEHYVRFLEYEYFHREPDDTIEKMIKKTEKQKTFWSRFFYTSRGL